MLPPDGKDRIVNSYLVFPTYQHAGWVKEHGGTPSNPKPAYINAKAELGYKHAPGSNPTPGGTAPVADHVGEVIFIPGQRLKIIDIQKDNRYWSVTCRQLEERG